MDNESIPQRKDTTLQMQSGRSRLTFKFSDVDPAKRRKDFAAARYLLSQATEALNIMEKNREVQS